MCLILMDNQSIVINDLQHFVLDGRVFPKHHTYKDIKETLERTVPCIRLCLTGTFCDGITMKGVSK